MDHGGNGYYLYNFDTAPHPVLSDLFSPPPRASRAQSSGHSVATCSPYSSASISVASGASTSSFPPRRSSSFLRRLASPRSESSYEASDLACQRGHQIQTRPAMTRRHPCRRRWRGSISQVLARGGARGTG